MTQLPLVSVILPTHNRAALLPRAIRSVLAQTWRELELIVVDDASTDDTQAVLREFDDPRLRVLRLETNSRAGAARNAAIRQARGSLLAFQDDDDVWLIQKLERQVAHLLAQPADVVLSVCSLMRMYPSGADSVGAENFALVRFDRGAIGDWSLLATPCWLLRREVLERIGTFDESLRIWEDWDLVYRLSREFRIAHLDEPLLLQDRIRAAGLGINSMHRDHADAYRAMLRKHGHEWTDRKSLARHHYRIGRLDALYKSAADARTSLLRAAQIDPANWRAWGAWALSYAGSGAIRRLGVPHGGR